MAKGLIRCTFNDLCHHVFTSYCILQFQNDFHVTTNIMLLSLNQGSVSPMSRRWWKPVTFTQVRAWQPQELKKKRRHGHDSFKSWRRSRVTDTTASRVKEEAERRTRQSQELKKQRDGQDSFNSWRRSRETDKTASIVEEAERRTRQLQ